MSQLKKLKFDYEHQIDSETGARVTRLTPVGAICHRTYFYQKSFTNDGKHLLFAGDFDGHWNYYLLDLNQQEARQLTQGAGDNTFGGFLNQDDSSFFYVKNDKNLYQVNLATAEHSLVYSVPDDWVGYGTWVPNSACTKIVGIEIKKDCYFELSDWKKFAEMYNSKPTCRLIRVDLLTGEREVISEQNTWLGHPIYRPFDDNTVAFCHEGPHDLVKTRMWMINEDGSNMRKVHEQADNESCTHEFWVPDGSGMIFVSYLRGEPERWICSVAADGSYSARIMQMPPCSHIMSNYDGTLLVGDGSDTPVDVADSSGHELANDPFLYVFDLRKKEFRKLCQHSSSWEVLQGSRQVNHPHPSFTPNDKQVLFGSDKDGTPAIYLADVQ